MRLLETLRVPDRRIFTTGSGLRDYMIEVYFSALGPPEFTTQHAGSFTVGSVDFTFGQPRLGRKWNVERIGVFTDRVFTSPSAHIGPPNKFAYNFQIYLNDVPVSAVSSLVYESDFEMVLLRDITEQNGPISIEPYSPIEMFSGDSLRVEMTAGVEVPLVSNYQIVTYATMRLQLIGTNESRV